MTLGSLQMITERHIPLWLHSLLKRAAVSDDVLNIVTVMQGVVSLLQLQNKASLEWHQIISSKKKKARTMPSADKIINTIFWDTGNSWWLNFCSEGEPSVLLTLFIHRDVPFTISAK